MRKTRSNRKRNQKAKAHKKFTCWVNHIKGMERAKNRTAAKKPTIAQVIRGYRRDK